jgi:formylglycine-generating enzyme required for sulfatase activity
VPLINIFVLFHFIWYQNSTTEYVTEAELFGWSFVLDSLASSAVVAEVDGKTGYGRVKTAKHWMAVKGANWYSPFGIDSSSEIMFPVVHVSYKDAQEYCSWAGKRLPSEHEWELAARGGRHNQSYPWGDKYKARRMNIWEGKFPEENLLSDGFHGVAPVLTYPPQTPLGLHNMLGNVWEWTLKSNRFLSRCSDLFLYLFLVMYSYFIL